MDVSVLFPYRNAASTVAEALASVLSQVGVSLEVIAVDDGSSDEGRAVVDRLAAVDPRLVSLESARRGIVGALQTGLARARGRFVARMDADDVSLPGRFVAEVELLERDARLGAVGTLVRAFPVEAVGEGMSRYVAWQNRLVSWEDHERDLFVESPLCHPSAMLPRRVLEEVGGWREVAWAEDYDLWLRLCARGYRLAKVPEVLLLWRFRAGRLTFADPRYLRARFVDARAHYLAPRLLATGRPIAVWGAGATGKRMARALERCGARAVLFVDIDPKKLGRQARGAPIAAPEVLTPGGHSLVVAVGAQGARDDVRRRLGAMGFFEGPHFVCAA